jgi:N-acetylneuraminate synthase
MRTFIIAEAGVNHNGSLEMAKQLVTAAKECDADAIKFQTFKAEKLVTLKAEKAAYQKSGGSEGSSQYDMLRKLELSDDDLQKLMTHCNQEEITFLSSPFDEHSVDLLDSLGISKFKIPSGEITNLPFLAHIAPKNKPVILSTGMSTLGEVETAIDTLNAVTEQDITLLHCVSEYPAPFDEINLKAMIAMREAFKLKVGYSDHTLGIEIPLAAVALGASMIEKHFTLDNNLPGPDHKASLNPYDMARMIKAIRNVEAALGDGRKKPTPSERKNMGIVRKSIVAAQALEAGEVISESKLTIKRPGYGIAPPDMPHVVGLIAKRRIEKDEVIQWHSLT